MSWILWRPMQSAEHVKKGFACFTNEFLSRLPMGEFFANWVYLLCAQLAYNVSLWIRDLMLTKPYRKKHIKRIQRCIGLIASGITTNGRQIRMKISTMHRWREDFVRARKAIPSLNMATSSGWGAVVCIFFIQHKKKSLLVGKTVLLLYVLYCNWWRKITRFECAVDAWDGLEDGFEMF